jgi:hypothetical protein
VTEPLNKPRSEFAAVALSDGKVLVAGGYNQAEQSYSSAYVFDPGPGAETWTKVGLLGTARTAPAAAVLPDGRVLVAGGYFYTGPIEYTGMTDGPDLVLAAYRQVAPRGGEPWRPPLDDVDVPPVGYALATAELFDPATGTWSPTGPMQFARTGAEAVTLADGRILVVGSGEENASKVDGRAYETAEIYDAATGKFTLAGQLPPIDRRAVEKLGAVLPDGDPAPYANGTLVALNDGDAILYAHTATWKHQGDITRSFRFDAAEEQWAEIGPPCAAAEDPRSGATSSTPAACRLDAAVATLRDGRMFLAGGQAVWAATTDATRTAEVYDPVADTWSPLPVMPEGRERGAAVMLPDGSMLLIGGVANTPDGEFVYLTSTLRFVP